MKDRILGKGSYGVAWLAKDIETGSYVVIKELILAHLPTSERERALREANLLSQLSHPNIIAYKQNFVENGTLNIVTGYANRGDLQSFVRNTRKPLEESIIIYIAIEILKALVYLHTHNVIHRDVKPANVFLSEPTVELPKKYEERNIFHVMLGDFGIAKVLEDSDLATTLVGTPYYLSPELVSKHVYSKKSDIWSLGVLLYELASQKRPFTGRTIVSIAMQIVEKQCDPLPDRFSKRFCDIILAMLKKEEEHRPTAAEALTMFKALKNNRQHTNNIVDLPKFSLMPVILNSEYVRVLHAELVHRYRQLYKKAQSLVGRELLDKNLHSIIKQVLVEPSVDCIHTAVAQHFNAKSIIADSVTDLVVCIMHSWMNTGSFTPK